MIFMTMLYIEYLGYQNYYEGRFPKALEMTNEAVFVLIQYCFVLLHNLVFDVEARVQIGNWIVGMTAVLLCANMAVIVFVSIKAICRKCYLKKVKKANLKKHLEAQKNKAAQPVAATVPHLKLFVPPPNPPQYVDSSSSLQLEISSSIKSEVEADSSSSQLDSSAQNSSAKMLNFEDVEKMSVAEICDKMKSYGLTPIGVINQQVE